LCQRKLRNTNKRINLIYRVGKRNEKILWIYKDEIKWFYNIFSIKQKINWEYNCPLKKTKNIIVSKKTKKYKQEDKFNLYEL